ncbi:MULTISPECIES: DUF7661 family protein [Rahnella]|jgi:hypothetical protein|uniref:DUF7661 domain-containing protein n=1 Tax=Rahnella contaminans TaxID=2703882 RepID=A0A6M2B4R1_9GAMM|nr:MULTISPECIES: hypothetical protein [Rahnella]KAB8308364.1 hypothetical protein EH227_10360 [Rouxiella chamberiensis]MBU9820008.1 hypothetical protein [Rahnella sp. BCC 1045]MCS3422098.1 hypothetical protein [Rahnella sp. BIGb0603]MDF1893226.1 hypothetical protein [Rahnella contaminans]NGX88088.1 hypothetical protein [Rahnella contaminans]
MLIYNVFGRYLGVKKTPEGWQVFRAEMTERKFSRLYDIIIPDDMTEAEIPGWLGDIFHESATELHPDVWRIE